MRVLAFLAIVAVATAIPQPSFPTDGWSATETDNMVVHQGPYTFQGGQYCCPANQNCQVQIRSQAGQNYVDYKNQRTRFNEFGGQDIVTDFKIGKEMLVVNNTCQQYCPTQGDELSPGFLSPNATFAGYKTVNGKNTSDWEWKETILGVIVMEIVDVFVEVDENGVATPIEEVDQLTPFGQPIGESTSAWNNFKAGIPDASLFDIAGVENCQESPNCNQNSLQMNRIRNKMWHSYMKYRFGDSAILE